MIRTSCTSASARTGCGTATTGPGPSPSTRRLWATDPEAKRHDVPASVARRLHPRAARTAYVGPTAAEGGTVAILLACRCLARYDACDALVTAVRQRDAELPVGAPV